MVRLRALCLLPLTLAVAANSQIRFEDVAGPAGLRFVLENSPTPEKRMFEAVPGGLAAFDYDNDGLTDLYFTNGADSTSLKKQGAKHENRLFRNLGGMKFTDVTAKAGVAGSGYSMGAAVADYDNDGDIDLFVAGVRGNTLFRNNGDGTFTDRTDSAGLASNLWSVAAGWLDYDNDGLLDLFVVHYLDWSPEKERYCGDRERNLRVYCSPTYFEGLPNALYRNRGDGTFEDVSKPSGIAAHIGKGMSAAFADYDLDGFVDIFVANDTEADFLFHNNGSRKFEETGLLAGVAFSADGKATSSMGVDFRDYDNDGLPDLSVTALTRQTFPLFRNQGDGFFEDAGHLSGMIRHTVGRSGWANGFVDFDNDGLKDLFTANAHVNDLADQFENTSYEQPNAVFRNVGEGRFKDVSETAAEFQPKAHRGAAFADFDNDGRVDVVVSAIGKPAELWRNVSAPTNDWLDVHLMGTKSNRDGIGARIHIGNQTNTMTSSVGYASSSHAPAHFGLGASAGEVTVKVLWPSGAEQELKTAKLRRVVKIVEPN